jgi:hypothetical protein
VLGAAPSSAPTSSRGPRLGDQPLHQVGPHPLEAQLGCTSGGALLGGKPALAGELLVAGRLVDVVVGDGAADGRLGGVEVVGELGDAPAVTQQGLQAAAEVGEAQSSGLLVEAALLGVDDREAPLDNKVARRSCCCWWWWWCFPCARGAGRPTTPGDPRLSGHQCSQRSADSCETKRMGNAAAGSGFFSVNTSELRERVSEPQCATNAESEVDW